MPAAMINMPPGTGQVISTAGESETTTKENRHPGGDIAGANGGTAVKASHVYATPGTYFAVLHAVSQRTGDANAFAKIQNLDRVRIVVQ